MFKRNVIIKEDKLIFHNGLYSKEVNLDDICVVELTEKQNPFGDNVFWYFEKNRIGRVLFYYKSKCENVKEINSFIRKNKIKF